MEDKQERCPAILKDGVCFAGNSDPSCEECKTKYEEQKAKENINALRLSKRTQEG